MRCERLGPLPFVVDRQRGCQDLTVECAGKRAGENRQRLAWVSRTCRGGDEIGPHLGRQPIRNRVQDVRKKRAFDRRQVCEDLGIGLCAQRRRQAGHEREQRLDPVAGLADVARDRQRLE
jgi:hypothetical protein